MKAITLSWEEVEAWFNGDNKDCIVQVFQECIVQTNSRGEHFWTENLYRYRILYEQKKRICSSPKCKYCNGSGVVGIESLPCSCVRPDLYPNMIKAETPAPKPENPDVVQKRGWICECGHVQRDHIGFSKYCLVCSCKVFKKRAETPAPNLACVKCGGKVFYPLDGGFCCEKCGGMKPTPKPEPPENEDVLSDHYYTPASNDEYEKPVTKPTEFIGELVGGRPEFPGKPPGETPAPKEEKIS